MELKGEMKMKNRKRTLLEVQKSSALGNEEKKHFEAVRKKLSD